MHQDTDQIQRFIFDATDIRGEIVTLDNSFSAATEHQPLSPWSRQLLGQFLSAAALMSETLKFDGLLTLQARGDGPVPLIMVEIDNLGHLRGIVKPAEGTDPQTLDLGDKPLPQIIGQGVLVLTIDPKIGERYQGIVPLEADTLAGCLSDYFARSEQLATRFWLFSDEQRCGGMLLQALPPQKVTDADKRQEQWQTAEQLAATVTREELLELPHADLLFRLFNEFECRLFPGRTIQFQCSCSRARSANAISSIGKGEAMSLLAERKVIEINCEFCGTQYQFNKRDIEQLFGEDEGRLH